MDVYRALQQRIDSLPVPFPQTESGVELRLLRHLFSEEEAAVASEMSAVGEPVEKIRRRIEKRGLHYESGALRNLLDGLLAKGAITGSMVKSGGKRVRGYSLLPLAVGMFEMQVDQLTRAYTEDFEDYLDEAFGDAMIGSGTGQLRTVPVGTAITSAREVGLYDDIKAHVASVKGPFAVMNCVCRQAKDLLEEPCDHGELRETCLTIGLAAVGMSRRGNARLVPREEFLSLLDRAEENGFVIQPQNTREPSYICCCCGDCCEILTTAKKLPRPSEVFHTNHFARVEASSCTGCGRCLRRCQMDAISLSDAAGDTVASVDRDRCIGCGLCVSTCASASICLVPVGRPKAPPRTQTAMFSRMYIERRGLLKTLGVFANVALKRKV